MPNILKKKIRSGLLPLLLIFVCTFTKAQVNVQWAQNTGSTGYDRSQNITVDAVGNIYTTGYFSGVVDFDPGSAVFTLTAAVNDIFISKISPSGAFIWAKQLVGDNYGIGMSIAVDATNNVIVTGYFNGTVDLDPGPGNFAYNTITGEDAFILKLDAAGNFIWAAPFGGTQNDNALGVDVDAGGNIYATGFFQGTPDFDPAIAVYNLTSFGSNDIFVLKLTATGNFVWAQQLGGASQDAAYGITVDGVGNSYLAGTFLGVADFDPAATTYTLNASNFSAFVCKLTASGNFLWAGQVGDPSGGTTCQDIKLDATNNVYITGNYIGAVDFDPGAATYTIQPIGNSDIYIDKLDQNGNFVWARSMGGPNAESGMSITTDPAGNVYSTGYFTGPADFDPGAGASVLTGSVQTDIYISKLDAAGNFVWAQGIGSFGQEYGFGIAVDAGNVIITGIFENLVDFDPGAGTYFLPSNGNFDAFTAKYCQGAPAQPGAIIGITAICDGSSANYSITPVPGANSYTWTLPGSWNGTSGTNTIGIVANTSSGNLTVTANNICGQSAQQTLNITVYALPSVTITTSNTLVCIGNTATLNATSATSYTWGSGANTSSIVITPTVNTVYSLNVSDIHGCVNSFAFNQFTDPCLGIKNNPAALNGIKIYPNPVGALLRIETQNEGLIFLTMYNALGQIVFTESINSQQATLNIAHLPKAIYLVNVTQGNSIGNYKLVKE
ncbi:MAG: SBBP repeat-containing protein [Bacteroidetes bacterium]|nr:SBBP repeat-containing protein [Bacteroidota bacterium]